MPNSPMASRCPLNPSELNRGCQVSFSIKPSNKAERMIRGVIVRCLNALGVVVKKQRFYELRMKGRTCCFPFNRLIFNLIFSVFYRILCKTSSYHAVAGYYEAVTLKKPVSLNGNAQRLYDGVVYDSDGDLLFKGDLFADLVFGSHPNTSVR